MDQLPRLGMGELICLSLFTCNYVVSVRRGFLFLWVLGMGYVILLWHSMSLSYNYFGVYVLDILVFETSFSSSYSVHMEQWIMLNVVYASIAFILFVNYGQNYEI